MLFMTLVIVMCAITGCSRITDAVKRGIVTLDDKAESNEVVVKKLCTRPDTVTEDERATAIQNAHMLHFGTSEYFTLIVNKNVLFF